MMKVKWKKRLWAVAVGLFLGGMQSLGAALEVQAAEEPVVSGLQVAAADDNRHILAQCDYQNYNDGSGCVMTLYLYQMEEDKQAAIAAYKIIPYAETGKCSTESAAAVDGLYQASVGMSYNGIFKQINSDHYYRVTRSEGRLEVTEVEEPAQNETEKKEEPEYNETIEREQEERKNACIHNLDYELIQSATPERDGILSYQCTVCGDVFEYVEIPNSAYEAFQRDAVRAVRNAGTDEVIISTDRWISFHKSVFEAISKRPDVAIVIQYRYQGEDCEVKIPAGADVSTLADENGFCGFRYLEQIFDETLP